MEKFVKMLLALKLYIKQYHWLAKGYDNHILADKLEEELDEYIDEAAELFTIKSEDLSGIYAANILGSASEHLKDFYSGEDMKLYFPNLISLIVEILDFCSTFKGEGVLQAGYGDYVGRLSNLLLKKLYLLEIQRKK